MGKLTKEKFPFVERDISWMYFNRRILYEAGREDIPLLERVNFLGIYHNNLDEFFMVRVASLRRIMDAGSALPKSRRDKAAETLKAIYKLNDRFMQQSLEMMVRLFDLLAQEGIELLNDEQLDAAQQAFVVDFYRRELAAYTIPLFLRKGTLSDDQVDESLYLAVQLEHGAQGERKEKKKDVAIVRLPVELTGRFIQLPSADPGKVCLIFLDDLMRYCLPHVFAGLPYSDFKAYAFKFTKDKEIDLSDDIDQSLVEKVSKALRKRKRGEKLRIVFDRQMPDAILQRLLKQADIDRYDAKVSSGRYHNTRDLMDFPACGRQDLLYPRQPPILEHQADLSDSMFARIRRGDLLFHFPYQSFDNFTFLLREAAISDEVKEIKVTLYRVARDSHVIHAIMAAAKNGVRVTAVVELMARFDEERNISWSEALTAAGVNVVFGPEPLKVHAKLVYIATKHGDLACIGTGNMHEGTAKVYTDYMLMTANPEIVEEVGKVFSYIEAPFLNISFQHLLVSPNEMRKPIIGLINQEIRNRRRGLPAAIKVKINHITDPQIVQRLYAAAQAGVDVQLLVRGNCSLVPGVRGVSEGIRVNAIIDRYLEHARILYFCNNGQPKVYIGSADWMERNLDRRIEVMCPVVDRNLQAELLRTIACGLDDVSQGHYVNEHEGQPRRLAAPQPWFRSQAALYQFYQHHTAPSELPEV